MTKLKRFNNQMLNTPAAMTEAFHVLEAYREIAAFRDCSDCRLASHCSWTDSGIGLDSAPGSPPSLAD